MQEGSGVQAGSRLVTPQALLRGTEQKPLWPIPGTPFRTLWGPSIRAPAFFLEHSKCPLPGHLQCRLRSRICGFCVASTCVSRYTKRTDGRYPPLIWAPFHIESWGQMVRRQFLKGGGLCPISIRWVEKYDQHPGRKSFQRKQV